MTRSHLLAAALGAVLTLSVMAMIGATQPPAPSAETTLQAQPDTGQDWDTGCVNIVAAYEQEWHRFFFNGLMSSADPEIQAIVLSDQMKDYLVVSSGIASAAKRTDPSFSGSDEASGRALEEFMEQVAFLKKERSDILYQLITGPWQSRLTDDHVARSFPPNNN